MAPLLSACARVALTLLGVSLLAFAVIHAMPADPATIVLVQRNVPVTPETIAALHAQWGLDRPVAAQYVHWLGRFVAGDWGISFQTDAPIVREFAARLPTSLTIGLGGIAVGLAAAVPLGYAAAVRPGRPGRSVEPPAERFFPVISGVLAWLPADLGPGRRAAGGSARSPAAPSSS